VPRRARAREMEGPSQTERVVLALRQMLLRGEFKPGERLAELTLVPRLGASRTPVRLALDRLAHEGLLEPLPTAGFRVREFALADIWDAIELRGVLEGTAARLAAERLADPEQLATLRRCCREASGLLPMTLDRFIRYIELNELFHAELWRLPGSRMLLRSIENLLALPFAAPGALVFSDGGQVHSEIESVVAIEQHRAILDAIERREGTRAEAVAREHARVALRALERALKDKDLFDRVPGARLVKG
jgi:GntR family transcriptional regulator, vanillate catabolism transcriptional regulator